jgi:hypothetical protein
MRRFVLLVFAGVLVSGCSHSKPPQRFVRIPDVVGLAADRGMERIHAVGLCPRPRLADTIGSPPYSTVAAVNPAPGVRVRAGTIVTVDVAPASGGTFNMQFIRYKGC